MVFTYLAVTLAPNLPRSNQVFTRVPRFSERRTIVYDPSSVGARLCTGSLSDLVLLPRFLSTMAPLDVQRVGTWLSNKSVDDGKLTTYLKVPLPDGHKLVWDGPVAYVETPHTARASASSEHPRATNILCLIMTSMTLPLGAGQWNPRAVRFPLVTSRSYWTSNP